MRAAIYARVSTDHQVDGSSLDEQVRKCRQEADRRGWEVVQVYREGFTGTQDSRPELDQLLTLCANGAVGAVLVSKLDRLARDEIARILTMRELAELDVQLVALDLGGADHRTEEGELIHGIVGQVAAWERRRLLRRMAEGQHGKARAGRWPASPSALPYGYRLEGRGRTNRVVHNADEVAMLRLVVGWIVDEGLTRGQAAQRLNAEGYRQRNRNPWHQDNLRDVLRKNRGLVGELSWGGKKSSGKYGDPITIQVEPIITEERWVALQEALSRNTRVAGQKREFLLGGGRLVSPCGLSYGGVSRQADGSRIYRCKGRRWNSTGAPKCSCANIKADTIDARVWAEVRDLLGRPERLLRLASDYYANRADQVEAERSELDQITTHLAKLENALTNEVAEYLRQGVPADVVKAAADRIRDEMAELRGRRAELAARVEDANGESERMRALIELSERASTRLVNMGLAEQAEVLKLLDVRVTVLENDHEPSLRITGVVPIQQAGSEP
ncbi:recombinase family protein [Sphaerisporangium flaviroseum]|uniref:recombinase family protein n=1 Tax=Sphaerisporangium flaviroseum TaxID=509199 RepID=UPI0031EA5CFC